jgi:hypothetical protein
MCDSEINFCKTFWSPQRKGIPAYKLDDFCMGILEFNTWFLMICSRMPNKNHVRN